MSLSIIFDIYAPINLNVTDWTKEPTWNHKLWVQVSRLKDIRRLLLQWTIYKFKADFLSHFFSNLHYPNDVYDYSIDQVFLLNDFHSYVGWSHLTTILDSLQFHEANKSYVEPQILKSINEEISPSTIRSSKSSMNSWALSWAVSERYPWESRRWVNPATFTWKPNLLRFWIPISKRPSFQLYAEDEGV